MYRSSSSHGPELDPRYIGASSSLILMFAAATLCVAYLRGASIEYRFMLDAGRIPVKLVGVIRPPPHQGLWSSHPVTPTSPARGS
jgi:hypothetical protein